MVEHHAPVHCTCDCGNKHRKPTDWRTRFWDKVEIGAPDECWTWTAAKDYDGYGKFNSAGAASSTLAHRIAYTLLEGDIPAGLVLDHLCRTPSCVNPKHLEPVANHVNVERGESGAWLRAKTHCPRGHEYTPENTYIIPSSGSRTCRQCKRIESKSRWEHEKRARLELKDPPA